MKKKDNLTLAGMIGVKIYIPLRIFNEWNSLGVKPTLDELLEVEIRKYLLYVS